MRGVYSHDDMRGSRWEKMNDLAPRLLSSTTTRDTWTLPSGGLLDVMELGYAIQLRSSLSRGRFASIQLCPDPHRSSSITAFVWVAVRSDTTH
jgi:hypothetical protein